MSFSSAPQSDAYIGRVDLTGRVLFEKAFGEGLYGPGIGTITVLPAGEAVVTGGQVYGPLWIAKLTPEGDVEWLHAFPRKEEPLSSRDGGKPSGIVLKSIASGPNGELIAAGFKGTGWTGSDAPTLWILNDQGEPTNEIQVGNAPALFVLPSSKIMVAWPVEAKIKLFVLNAQTGDVAENETPVPDCLSEMPMDLFFGKDEDGATFLCGSPRGVGVEGRPPPCVWLESILVEE